VFFEASIILICTYRCVLGPQSTGTLFIQTRFQNLNENALFKFRPTIVEQTYV